jgi:hypothetical protein
MVRVDTEKSKKETVMEQEMYITIPYSLAISNVNDKAWHFQKQSGNGIVH